jgi:hypothetical protein
MEKGSGRAEELQRTARPGAQIFITIKTIVANERRLLKPESCQNDKESF